MKTVLDYVPSANTGTPIWDTSSPSWMGVDDRNQSVSLNQQFNLQGMMCAEKTGGFNLVNYRHSSGVYHEQETEDLHRRI